MYTTLDREYLSSWAACRKSPPTELFPGGAILVAVFVPGGPTFWYGMTRNACGYTTQVLHSVYTEDHITV